MRFCTFQSGHKTTAGLIVGHTVYDLSQTFFRHFRRPSRFPDLLSFLQGEGRERMSTLDVSKYHADPTCAFPLSTVQLRAPILRPPKIICVGINYRSHAEEQKIPLPVHPILFAKAPNTTIGPGEEIVIPRGISEQIDHEVELAVVIGKEGFQIPRADALSHVLGFTIFNDVTARDIQRGDKQWFRGKSFATFAPSGPVVVTPEELDVTRLDLRLRVNGTLRQSGNTSDLLFDIPALIEFISAGFPLEVGDLIATGTPSGVGMYRTPPVWLKPGDRVEAEIPGIGTLSNTVRSASPQDRIRHSE